MSIDDDRLGLIRTMAIDLLGVDENQVTCVSICGVQYISISPTEIYHWFEMLVRVIIPKIRYSFVCDDDSYSQSKSTTYLNIVSEAAMRMDKIVDVFTCTDEQILTIIDNLHIEYLQLLQLTTLSYITQDEYEAINN